MEVVSVSVGPSLEQLLSEVRELKQRLHEIEYRLHEVEHAIQAWIVKENSAAWLFERVTSEFILRLLQGVLKCMSLPEDRCKKFAAGVIERAETELEFEPGTFRSVFEANVAQSSGMGSST